MQKIPKFMCDTSGNLIRYFSAVASEDPVSYQFIAIYLSTVHKYLSTVRKYLFTVR